MMGGVLDVKYVWWDGWLGHRFYESEVRAPEVHGWAVEQAAAEYCLHCRLVAGGHLQLSIPLPVHCLHMHSARSHPPLTCCQAKVPQPGAVAVC